MKILFIYPFSCEYAYPRYLDRNLDAHAFDEEVMCKTDLELRYLRGLAELGEDCALFYPRRFRLPIREFVHRGGYRIVRFPIALFEGISGWELPLSMLAHIKKESPDLVHFVGIYGGRYLYIRFFDIVGWYCRLHRIPFFGWYHVGHFPQGRRFPILWYPSRRITAATLRSCEGITSVNLDELRRLFDPESPDYYGIHFSGIPYKRMPNTFDPHLFFPRSKEVARKKLLLDGNKQYILTVARLFFEKGLHHLLRIMPRLSGAFPNVHLLVIGDFIEGEKKYQTLIQSLLRDLNIRERVSFLGRIEHQDGLPDYYSAADVFVLPTLKESFGAVNLEALACGTPVVSSKCGEIPYYLKRGLGIVVPPGDESALLSAISQVLSGQFNFDEKEREKILSEYNYQTASAELKRWYKEVLSKEEHFRSD